MISEPEIVTAPAAEPLTLAEAKAHLRVDHSDDDALIQAQIIAARQMVESFTRQRLITQTLRFTYDWFPARLEIPVWPVQSVSSVKYDDAEGNEQTLAASRYTLVKHRPRVLTPAYSDVWPSTRLHWGAVRVDVVCGYGAAGSAVPGDIMAALKLVLASLYEQREGVIVGVDAMEHPGMTAPRALLLPHVLY